MLDNKIYESIIGFCELLEDTGSYNGNGHHLAQKLTRLVGVGILPKKQKEIVKHLTSQFQTTKEIAHVSKTPTKNVSSQLLQAHKKISCLDFKKDEKGNASWRILR